MGLRSPKRPAQAIFIASCLAVVALGTGASGAGASGGLTPPPPPDTTPGTGADRGGILERARLELGRKVRENGGDNVPRYRFGKGRIAPYSIGDQWCASFATWIWGEAGFDSFRYPTRLRNGKMVNVLKKSGTLWKAHDGKRVAVQVKALRKWAGLTNRRTFRASPGDLIAYGDQHIGVVIKVDRKNRTIRSIEGNYDHGVRARTISMSDTIDYFTPEPLSIKKRVLSARSAAADIEFDKNSPYRPAITPVEPVAPTE